MKLVVLEGDELSVDECILDVFVAEEFHDVKDVFGFGVFCCGFPVSEGVKVDFAYALVFEFGRYSFSLSSEGSSEVSLATGEGFLFIICLVVQHVHELDREGKLSRFAAFFRCDVNCSVLEVYVGPFEQEGFSASHACFFKQLKESCCFLVASSY